MDNFVPILIVNTDFQKLNANRQQDVLNKVKHKEYKRNKNLSKSTAIEEPKDNLDETEKLCPPKTP